MKNIIKILLVLVFILRLTSCKSNNNTVVHNKKYANRFEKIFKKYKGVPYKYGGTTSKGFDCSGFVQRAFFEAYKMKLPRTTKAMMKFGNKINKKQLKIGDLVFFHTTRRYYHVGIYMGNNIFMHASGSRGISKSSLDNSYWKKRYIFSRRVL